jgi:hypothetical protein
MSPTGMTSPDTVDFESPDTNPALLDLLGLYLYQFAQLQDGSPGSLRAYDFLVTRVVNDILLRFRFPTLVGSRTDDPLDILVCGLSLSLDVIFVLNNSR